MLQITIKNVLFALIEQELSLKGRLREGIYVNFDLRMNYKDYHISRGLHLIYHALPYSRYIDVFSGVTFSPFADKNQVFDWNHEMSHDSCWRDINVFSNVYFDMAEDINKQLDNDKLKHVAPAAMNEWNVVRTLFQWIPVQVSRLKDDPYQKVIELL